MASPDCSCGVGYSPGLGFALLYRDYLQAVARTSENPEFAEFEWALTYGIASGDVVAQDGWSTRRARKYTPLAICLPETRSWMKHLVGPLYGIEAIHTSTEAVDLRAVERTIRAQLQTVTPPDDPDTIIDLLKGAP